MRKNKAIEIPETTNSSNLDLYIQFTKLIKIYEYTYKNLEDVSQKNIYKHKIISLKNTAKHIKLFKDPIISTKQIETLSGIGKKSILRIQEFIDTKKLSDIDNYCNVNNCDLVFQSNKTNTVYDDLITIYGIGDKLAKTLINKYKISSVKELKKRVSSNDINVSDKVGIGLKYFGKVKNKIPRDELTKIREFIYLIFEKLDPSIVFDICGSYRRQKSYSNDIDLLVSSYTLKEDDIPNLMKKIIDSLYKNRLLIESFGSDESNSGFMGLCKFLNNPIRKIDIRIIEPKSFFTAYLYFTGSYEFNERMRGIAKRQGYKLNEYGLYSLHNTKQIHIYSEKDVFDILGMKYLDPIDRI
jgi:DNA polymerase/3'-5' exonuclease PolX